MKKKIVVLMLSAAMTMSMMTGCGNTAKDDSASTTTETTQDAEATEEAEPTEEATEEATDDSASDQEAADKVAALIDQIYVQERNDNTDEQCKEAKEAWDALTDAQKELVEGENADPDYHPAPDFRRCDCKLPFCDRFASLTGIYIDQPCCICFCAYIT